jgi:hypothetical protein
MPNLRWEPCLSAPATCPFWQRHIAPTIVKLQRDPEPVTARFAERFGHSPSYAMFLLLPIFAWFLALVYRSRKMYHGEHLVFSPHLHSVSFLLATFFLLLPQALGLGLPPWFVAYGLWAMHRVYGGPWRLAILRGATVTALSGLVLGLGAAALSLVLLAT